MKRSNFKGITMVETLASVTLITLLILIIWSLIISYQARLKQLKTQYFFINLAVNYQEIFYGDILYFSDEVNFTSEIPPFEKKEFTKLGVRYYFYYNDHFEIVPESEATYYVRVFYETFYKNMRKLYYFGVDSYVVNPGFNESSLLISNHIVGSCLTSLYEG